MNITEIIKEKAIALGANCCGIADLRPLSAHIKEVHGDKYQSFTHGISIAVRLPNGIMDEVAKEGPTKAYGVYYDQLNDLLNHIVIQLNTFIEDKGYKTYPIPASLVLGEKGDCSTFSHRMAANAAGLGWIGKSCSLINPQFGPRIRLATILIDAPLKGDAPLKNRCGSCTKCVDACPVSAIKDNVVDLNQPRSCRLDFEKCDIYLNEQRERLGAWVCGCCIAACPWGNN